MRQAGHRIYLIPDNTPINILNENDTSILGVAESLREEYDAAGFDIFTTIYDEDNQTIETIDHLYHVLVNEGVA
jgi:hypothetical protein